MTDHRRRDPRYPVRLRAALMRGHSVEPLVTENISRHGVFLATKHPPALRELVRVKLFLPPGGEEVFFHGMVAHAVYPTTRDATPGAGVELAPELSGLGSVDAARWARFLAEVEERGAEALSDPFAEGFEVRSPKASLRLGSLDALHRLYAENVSKGCLLLPTEQPIPEGTDLEVEVVHPATGGSFSLYGVVRMNLWIGGLAGAGLELKYLTPRCLADFDRFVKSASL